MDVFSRQLQEKKKKEEAPYELKWKSLHLLSAKSTGTALCIGSRMHKKF